MNRILAAVVSSIFMAIGVAPANAAAGESIQLYSVAINIAADGVTQFTETIDYDFGANSRHGIFRSIPLWDNLPNNKRRMYDVALQVITVDGTSASYTTDEANGFLTAKIGDSNVLLTGHHQYVIRYWITNALTTLTAADLSANTPGVNVGDIEFYWDVVGNAWNVPIDGAQIWITSPSQPLLFRCYSVGTSPCANTVFDGYTAHFVFTAMPSGQAATVVVTSPARGFTHVAPAHITDQPEAWSTQAARGLPIGGGIGLVLLIGVIGLALSRRSRIKTSAVNEVIRFEAPLGLRPAEMAVSWYGHFDGKALTATVLDLATRGVLTVETTDSKQLLVKRLDAKVALADWESALVQSIFVNEDMAELGTYDRQLSETVTELQKQLVAQAVKAGRRNTRAATARIVWRVAGGIGLLLSIASIAIVANGTVFFCVLLPSLALTVGSVIAHQITPLLQTPESAEFISSVLGFRKLLSTDAAAARREFAHRSGLSNAAIFATMLPFAVVFGLDQAWTSAFPDLTPEDLHSYGYYAIGMSGMHNLVSAGQQSLSATLTAPSSSGSGSGGGASGGGGGGGGGGSW